MTGPKVPRKFISASIEIELGANDQPEPSYIGTDLEAIVIIRGCRVIEWEVILEGEPAVWKEGKWQAFKG